MAKDLFIPRKHTSKVQQPDYGQDMRAIEIWAKSVGGGGGTTFYASLTGAGETNPTGQLIQAGDWQWSKNNVAISSQNAVWIDSGSPTFGTVAAAGVTKIQGGYINIQLGSGTGQVLIGSPAVPSAVQSVMIHNQADPNERLGFWGHTPAPQQSGAGITTIAQLVSALQAYGLLGP
jgi:hypothetical protein